MILRAIKAVLEREITRMIRQKARLIAAMVRPLIWLLVIGSGIGSMVDTVQGQSYITYLIPGVLGMTVLFGAMLAALTTVYDKESGVMRMMIVAPLPHYWIIIAKTLSASVASILQALILLTILVLLGFIKVDLSLFLVTISIILVSFACAGIGMLTASFSKSLDNFASVMNFIIFPIFFISGALYPVQELPFPLRIIAQVNPYTYAVDLLKHALATPSSASFAGGDFDIILDILVLLIFIVFSVLLSSWRFSRDDNQEPLIKRITTSLR